MAYSPDWPQARWSAEKNAWLARHRGVTFEQLAAAMQAGHVLDITLHPDPARAGRQSIAVVEVRGYAYLVPFVDGPEGPFLKTIVPSRKATRKYLGARTPNG